MIQFDEHIFQMGWFNHQLEKMFLFWFDFGTFLWNVLSWYKHAFVLYFNHKNNRLFVLVCDCVCAKTFLKMRCFGSSWSYEQDYVLKDHVVRRCLWPSDWFYRNVVYIYCIEKPAEVDQFWLLTPFISYMLSTTPISSHAMSEFFQKNVPFFFVARRWFPKIHQSQWAESRVQQGKTQVPLGKVPPCTAHGKEARMSRFCPVVDGTFLSWRVMTRIKTDATAPSKIQKKTNRTWLWHWRITIFNRRYIFSHGCDSIVMLVFGGSSVIVYENHQGNCSFEFGVSNPLESLQHFSEDPWWSQQTHPRFQEMKGELQ